MKIWKYGKGKDMKIYWILRLKTMGTDCLINSVETIY